MDGWSRGFIENERNINQNANDNTEFQGKGEAGEECGDEWYDIDTSASPNFGDFFFVHHKNHGADDDRR